MNASVSTDVVATAEESVPVWRFRDIEIDLARREIRRTGRTVDVQPRVFDLIVHLVRHRDRMVERDELLDEVWGTRFVAPSTVNGRIRVARRVLGDTGDEQSVIRTLHGRGYRFVAEVSTGSRLRSDGPGTTVPAPTPPSPAVPVAGSSGMPTHDWPLVGRVDVLEEIEALFAAGTVGGVVLTGVDGVGTSRTATAAAERLGARGCHVVTTRGLDGAADVPLSGIAHLIDASVLESAHTAADLARADVMHKATTALRSVAAGGRLVLVVDDVHHMDAMSLAVLASLIESRSIFAVIAARRTALASTAAFDSLVGIGSLRSIPIEPLTGIQVDVLLYRALRGPIDAGSLQAFVTASGGRPGHLRDLVDRARAAGALAFEGGVWRLVGPIPPRVPLTWPVHGLSDGAVRAAEILAIVGEIPVGLLGDLCDDDSIDELDGHRLLTVATGSDDPMVGLAEPALATVVVDSMGGLRRRRLRRRLAQWLLDAAPGDPSALTAVLDVIEIDEIDVTLDRGRACEVARRALVDGHVERAIRLIDRMTRWEEPDAIVLRAEAAAHRSQWELADTLLAETADRPLEPPWLTAAVTLGADLDFFQHARHEEAITTLARHTHRRDHDVERAAARRVWLLAEQGAADALTAELARAPTTGTSAPEWVLAHAVAALLAGRFAETLSHVSQLEPWLATASNPRHTHATLTLRCLALHQLGRLDEARDHARASLAHQGCQGLGLLPIVGAMLELEAGHPRAARVLLGTLADSSHVRRHPHLAPVASGTAGVVEATLGHHDAAVELFTIAERDLDRSPTRAAWMVRTAIATALADRDPERARRHAARVVADARRLGAALPEAEALMALSIASPPVQGRDVAARVLQLAADFEGERWRSIRNRFGAVPCPDAHVVRTTSP